MTLMTLGNRPPTVRADGRGPRDLRPVSFELGVQKWAEGSCLVQFGDTAGPVRGDDRRPRPAPPARQGHGLGHRRVLDAAARHGRADATASRPRAGSAAGPTRSSGSSGARCAASSTSPGSASGRSPSTATCSRPTAGPARRRSPAATSPWRRRSSRSAWSATSSARSRPSRSGIVNGLQLPRPRLLARIRRPRSTSTSSAPTPGRTSSCRAPPRASRSTGPPRTRCSTLPTRGLARLFDRPGRGPRHGPAVTGTTRPRSSSPRTRRTSCASCGSCSSSTIAELVSLDDLGITDDPVEDGETFETNAAIKARFAARPTRPADARRRLWASRSTRSAAVRASGPGATPASTPPMPTTTPSCCASSPACRPSAAAPATCACSPWRCPRTRARAAACRCADPRHLPRPDRDRAARDGRVRLRPDLRAGLRAAGRADARPVDPGREARDLASSPRRPADGADPGRARVLRRGRRAPHLRLLRREPGSRPGLRRARGRRSGRGWRRAASASSTAAAGSG